MDFVPSRIGSYWLNDINGDTEIDVMAVDHQKKQVFAGECKYHNKPVDATVYYELEEKVKVKPFSLITAGTMRHLIQRMRSVISAVSGA